MADEKTPETVKLRMAIDRHVERIKQVEAERDEARATLEKIDAIRNSIIGRQRPNWSMHIYPLVAALDEAGYGGEGYDVARPKAEAEVEEIRTLVRTAEDRAEKAEAAQKGLHLQIRDLIDRAEEAEAERGALLDRLQCDGCAEVADDSEDRSVLCSDCAWTERERIAAIEAERDRLAAENASMLSFMRAHDWVPERAVDGTEPRTRLMLADHTAMSFWLEDHPSTCSEVARQWDRLMEECSRLRAEVEGEAQRRVVADLDWSNPETAFEAEGDDD